MLISTQQTEDFSRRILEWFHLHGRHHLPWQHNPTPYRVWLSEIMLQQTQVTTVIGYYERFLNKFPTIQSLAEGSNDDVLSLWAGLGYYARARNLHKTAKIICNELNGEFPNSLEDMQQLPGIGRSTAAAILTFSLNQSHSILDGNVKRVLARHYQVEGWSGTSATLKQLWSISEAVTPKQLTAEFNQAMMDMGATVCTRSKPKCRQCCINDTCLAYKNDSWSSYPASKPKKKKPIKEAFFVTLKHNKNLCLEQRPQSGIWGGLWSLPEFASKELALEWLQEQVVDYDKNKININLNELKHVFSHYELVMHIISYDALTLSNKIGENELSYLSHDLIKAKGLPAPIKKIVMKTL